MYSFENNNFTLTSIYDLDKKVRNKKNNDRINMDVSGLLNNERY